MPSLHTIVRFNSCSGLDKSNRVAGSLLGPASCILHSVCEIPLVAGSNRWLKFSLPYNIPFYEYTIIYVSIQLLMEWASKKAVYLKVG